MILNDIITTVAGFLHRQPSDLIVNGINFGLVALNSARNIAELNYDFNFTRQLLQLNVDGVVGGRIDDAVEYYTQLPTNNKAKKVIDVGQFDTDGNLLGVEWTTVAESLNRNRRENRYFFRYPTDAQASVPPLGLPRFIFSNRSVYAFPKTTTFAPGTVFTIGFEAYCLTADWTASDLVTAPEPWGTKGHEYLLWYSVVYINNLFRDFVFRQEGNLMPPQDMAGAALESVINWDTTQYDEFRRKGR